MGVRLSPVTLAAAELTAAVQEVRARLGPAVCVVGSAPNVAAAELDPRAYVALASARPSGRPCGATR